LVWSRDSTVCDGYLLYFLVGRDSGCLSQESTERVLHCALPAISLKQIIVRQKILAIHVLDRFFSIQLHLAYKCCQFHILAIMLSVSICSPCYINLRIVCICWDSFLRNLLETSSQRPFWMGSPTMHFSSLLSFFGRPWDPKRRWAPGIIGSPALCIESLLINVERRDKRDRRSFLKNLSITHFKMNLKGSTSLSIKNWWKCVLQLKNLIKGGQVCN
jgi:hypothetical protein